MSVEPTLGAAAIEALLDELIAAQRRRVGDLAHRIDPRLTDEDLLSPDDIPALRDSSAFAYEDGHLAGLLAAQMALRAKLR